MFVLLYTPAVFQYVKTCMCRYHVSDSAGLLGVMVAAKPCFRDVEVLLCLHNGHHKIMWGQVLGQRPSFGIETRKKLLEIEYGDAKFVKDDHRTGLRVLASAGHDQTQNLSASTHQTAEIRLIRSNCFINYANPPSHWAPRTIDSIILLYHESSPGNTPKISLLDGHFANSFTRTLDSLPQLSISISIDFPTSWTQHPR